MPGRASVSTSCAHSDGLATATAASPAQTAIQARRAKLIFLATNDKSLEIESLSKEGPSVAIGSRRE
jgi:hypothetical protein